MIQSYRKNTIEFFAVILLITLLGLFYWQTVMRLPLFGDATIHGSNAKALLQGDWRELKADYPAHYSYLMAIFFVFFGEKGFNAAPYMGFFFLLLSSFIFVRRMTNNYYCGLAAILLVGCSPKIIFYTTKMYQEILIAGFFIFTIYFLFLYLEKNSAPMIFLLSFFVGITASIKQQGLFILFPSIVGFLIIDIIRKKTSLSEVSSVVIISTITALAYYGVLFHTKGMLQPGSNEFGPLKMVNLVGGKVFGYQQPEIPLDTHDIVEKLMQIEINYGQVAFQRAENRHIWPFEVFTNFEKFNQANNLYLLSWQGVSLENPILYYLSFSLILLGFLFVSKNIRKYNNLYFFSLIFLPINYLLFARNNDQQRYHIFLPIYLLIFSIIFVKHAYSSIRLHKYLKHLATTVFLILLFLPVLETSIKQNQWWDQSQLYTPSEGGITSVTKAGNWIRNNTNSQSKIGQQCGNETQYYSDREVLGDWRVDFLEQDDLKTYFQLNNISYYVINKSQIAEDSQWHHICWVPKSFYQKMNQTYEEIFTANSNDIFIFKTL